MILNKKLFILNILNNSLRNISTNKQKTSSFGSFVKFTAENIYFSIGLFGLLTVISFSSLPITVRRPEIIARNRLSKTNNDQFSK